MGTPHQFLFRLATPLSRLLLRSQPAGAAPRQALRPGPAFPPISGAFALAGRPAESASSQEVKVQMKHDLASIRADVR